MMKLTFFFFLLAGEIDKNFQEDIADIDPISSTTFVYNPNVSLSYDQQRQRLPIFNSRNHILYLLEKYQVLVLVGETGCGKSTQLPQVRSSQKIVKMFWRWNYLIFFFLNLLLRLGMILSFYVFFSTTSKGHSRQKSFIMKIV